MNMMVVPAYASVAVILLWSISAAAAVPSQTDPLPWPLIAEKLAEGAVFCQAPPPSRAAGSPRSDAAATISIDARYDYAPQEQITVTVGDVAAFSDGAAITVERWHNGSWQSCPRVVPVVRSGVLQIPAGLPRSGLFRLHPARQEQSR